MGSNEFMELLIKILLIIFLTFQGILALYLIIPTLLLVLHAFNAKGQKLLNKKYPLLTDKKYDFAAIVTAHQDTRFIPPLIDSFLRQSYPNFILYVVADDCDISDLIYTDPRVRVMKPGKALHAKIQSIKFAVDHFERQHDALIVFDSDNLVHPDYLERLNGYFNRGFRAVQTHMLSKNNETVYAKLDSIGHIYNTFTERQSKMELGLSSSILGLGIALDTNLYRQVMYQDSLGGFDKKLQSVIIRTVPQLGFAEDAIVYDEKVEDGAAMEKQRTRWIYTYFKYFKINWNILATGFRKLNFNLVFFGFNALRPPLFITMGGAVIFTISNIWIDRSLALAWTGLILLFIITFIIIVLTQSRQKGMFKALLYIPLIVMRQVNALFKIKKAGREFLKTEHIKVIYIEDLLKNENR